MDTPNNQVEPLILYSLELNDKFDTGVMVHIASIYGHKYLEIKALLNIPEFYINSYLKEAYSLYRQNINPICILKNVGYVEMLTYIKEYIIIYSL